MHTIIKAESRSRVHIEHKTSKCVERYKNYLSSPPVIIPPKARVPFRLYLLGGHMSIDTALIQEQDGKERVVFYESSTAGRGHKVPSD
jgi:hypothetical protein